MIVWNVMINGLALAGRWQEALALLQQMTKRELRRDLFGFCGVVKASYKAWAAGLATLAWAQRSFHMNFVLSSSIVSTCSSQWPIVLLLFSSMRRLRVANEQTFCAAISSQAWRTALYLFHLMPLAAVKRDLPCRNAAILKCRSAYRWRHALMIAETCKSVKSRCSRSLRYSLHLNMHLHSMYISIYSNNIVLLKLSESLDQYQLAF